MAERGPFRYHLLDAASRLLPPVQSREGGLVVFSPGHMGDILLTAPMLQQFRSARPTERVTWLVGPWSLPLARHYVGFADAVWPLAPDQDIYWRGNPLWRQSLSTQWRMARRLRQQRPATLISTGLDNAVARFLANVLEPTCWVLRADHRPPRIKRRVQTVVQPYDSSRYEADALAGLLNPLGIPSSPVKQPVYIVHPEERREAEDFLLREGLALDRPLVLLSPGSGWAGKNWPAPRFAALAGQLERGQHAQVAWLGGPGEERLLPAHSAAVRWNWVGRLPIPLLAAVMEQATVWVGNDSGPMHLAAAVGTPTVSIWGPTSPVVWAPRGERHIHFRRGSACPGCRYWDHRAACLLPGHDCIAKVEVGDVADAVKSLL
ncbi:MAG: glycosyltransferase family 9 protein [Verrucomicrobiota bacterium]|jgi:ADP-heptose:LPS heptosyltransferase|nr:glycosyltransferase family 9 protein [Verrucomicrobiota bacterium]